MTLNPALKRQRQVAPSVKGSLLYIVNFRLVKLHSKFLYKNK